MVASTPIGNYRLSLREYEAAVEAGAFRADPRLELLDGQAPDPHRGETSGKGH